MINSIGVLTRVNDASGQKVSYSNHKNIQEESPYVVDLGSSADKAVTYKKPEMEPIRVISSSVQAVLSLKTVLEQILATHGYCGVVPTGVLPQVDAPDVEKLPIQKITSKKD
jgi:hypothetical protein